MGGVNVQLQSFLIFALVEVELLASRHDLFDLGKESLVCTEYGVDGVWRREKFLCPYRE
jgi:hypothetical protein